MTVAGKSASEVNEVNPSWYWCTAQVIGTCSFVLSASMSPIHQALTTCFAFLPPAGEELERVFADSRVRVDGELAPPDLTLSPGKPHTIELLIHMHEPEVSM